MADEAVQNAATGDTGSAADESVLTPGAVPEEKAPETAGQGAETGADAAPAKEGDESILTPGAEEKGSEDIGAPEAYGDFTLPEGFTIDDEGKAQMSALFKGLNLSQKGGQKLVDAFTERVTAMKEAELNALAERRKAWRAEIRQRPTFATDRALALKGLNAVVSEPEEKALFTNSWMSDHPALFSVFVKVGKLLGEDSPLPNGGQSPAGGSAVARFPVKM